MIKGAYEWGQLIQKKVPKKVEFDEPSAIPYEITKEEGGRGPSPGKTFQKEKKDSGFT